MMVESSTKQAFETIRPAPTGLLAIAILARGFGLHCTVDQMARANQILK